MKQQNQIKMMTALILTYLKLGYKFVIFSVIYVLKEGDRMPLWWFLAYINIGLLFVRFISGWQFHGRSLCDCMSHLYTETL